MRQGKWHPFLWAEIIIFFVVIPFSLFFLLDELNQLLRGNSAVFAILLPITISVLVYLKLDPAFPFHRIFLVRNFKHELLDILKLFVPFALLTTVYVRFFDREILFFLPRNNPGLWLLIMVFYPLFSVLPQGLIYRVFFFHRYGNRFAKNWHLIGFNAFLFCLAHVFFKNEFALGVTFVGGLLFATRYYKTKSFLISSLEHALYGNWLFTIGLGRYLVSGMVE